MDGPVNSSSISVLSFLNWRRFSWGKILLEANLQKQKIRLEISISSKLWFISFNLIRNLNIALNEGTVPGEARSERPKNLKLTNNLQICFQDFTGYGGVNTGPILEYFKPLEDWLENYIQVNNITVGWQ